MNITYIQISFSFGAPKDKFQVTSLLRFYSHNLSFLMTNLKIFLESLLTILMLIWIFFFLLILRPPGLEILGPSWKDSMDAKTLDFRSSSTMLILSKKGQDKIWESAIVLSFFLEEV